MSTFISMLRGINVGGQKTVKMDALQKMFESLGYKNVRTYVQSGNVVFESADAKALDMATKIENQITKIFGFEVPVIIRSEDDCRKLIKANPFLNKDIDELYVTFLLQMPASVPVDDFNKIKDKEEEYFVSGKEIFLVYPNGYGRTKLNNNYFEKKLRVKATTRNWKTVMALWNLANDKSIA